MSLRIYALMCIALKARSFSSLYLLMKSSIHNTMIVSVEISLLFLEAALTYHSVMLFQHDQPTFYGMTYITALCNML